MLRFLLPFDFVRRAAVRRVETQIRSAVHINEPDRVSAIAHSFGSYLFARALADQFDVAWNRIIFCGGVASAKFPLEQFAKHRFKTPIVNEIGTRDSLPAVAEAVTWGYGSVGSHGFNSPSVHDRWHRGLSHSDFLTPSFCRKYWVPFLLDGTIIEADEPDKLPLLTRIVTRLPLRWIALVLLSLGLFCLNSRFGLLGLLKGLITGA